MKRIYGKICIAVIILLVVFALIKSGMMEESDVIRPRGALVVLSGNWNKVPERDGQQLYEYRIPDDCGTRLVLSMESYWCSMKLYLDGEELYSFEDRYMEKGRSRHWIELPEGAAGKVLTLELPGDDSLARTTLNGGNYLGEPGTVFFKFWIDNLYAIFLGIGVLLMCGAMLFCNLYLRRKRLDGNYLGGWYAMFFILTAGIWIMTDSQIWQMFVGKGGMICLISFLSFTVMPIFLILCIQEMLICKRRVLYGLCAAFAVNAAAYAVIYLFRLAPLFGILPVTHVLIFLSMIFVLKYGLEEIRKKDNAEIKKIMIGCGILIGFCCVALVMFLNNPLSGYSVCFLIGMVFYCIFLVAASFDKTCYYLETGGSAEVYREMAYLDALTGVANRNAFENYLKQETHPETLAILVFDVNDLKLINDRYGHQEGDRIIQEAAECIRESFGRIGKCYRIGGDEFAVIVQEASQEEIEQALAMCVKIRKRMNKNREFSTEFAWGCARRENGSIPVADLFTQADNDMYQRKAGMKAENLRGGGYCPVEKKEGG